jgi:hypothetical protein
MVGDIIILGSAVGIILFYNRSYRFTNICTTLGFCVRFTTYLSRIGLRPIVEPQKNPLN